MSRTTGAFWFVTTVLAVCLQPGLARLLLQANVTYSPPPPSPVIVSAPPGNSFVIGAAVGTAFGAAVVAALFGAVVYWRWRRRQRHAKQHSPQPSGGTFGSASPILAHTQLSASHIKGTPSMAAVNGIPVAASDGNHPAPGMLSLPPSFYKGGGTAAQHVEYIKQVKQQQTITSDSLTGTVAVRGPGNLASKMSKVPQQLSASPPHSNSTLPPNSASSQPDTASLNKRAVSDSLTMPAEQPGSTGGAGPPSSGIVSHRQLQQMTGLIAGDPFLRGAATAYKWCVQPIDKGVAVEEGVNAARAAGAVASKGLWQLPGSSPGPDAVKLGCKEVMEQIELLPNGLIGRGATAIVFKCRWPSRFGKNGLLAAKVLPNPGDTNTHHMLQSFRYECSVLQKCRHRNIVRLYGYCLEPPTVCLIMELLPGSLKSRLYGGSGVNSVQGISPALGPALVPPTLKVQGNHAGVLQPAASAAAKLNSSNSNDVGSFVSKLLGVTASAPLQTTSSTGCPMSMAEVLQVSIDIVAGVAHLHAKDKNNTSSYQLDDDDDDDDKPEAQLNRVIHRDLKPDNILINSKGVAKISDFGLAREHVTSALMTDQPNVGTLRYMAPELISGQTNCRLSSKVDLYSLAILMWEMIAREVPWANHADLQIPVPVSQGKRPPTPGFDTPPAACLDLTGNGLASNSHGNSCNGLLGVLPPSSAMASPADFKTLPQFTTVIHACWQDDPKKRPTAATVLKQLQLLETILKAQRK